MFYTSIAFEKVSPSRWGSKTDTAILEKWVTSCRLSSPGYVAVLSCTTCRFGFRDHFRFSSSSTCPLTRNTGCPSLAYTSLLSLVDMSGDLGFVSYKRPRTVVSESVCFAACIITARLESIRFVLANVTFLSGLPILEWTFIWSSMGSGECSRCTVEKLTVSAVKTDS